MNSDHTQRLFGRFDYLYRGRYLPKTESLMCFGFECEDGWFELVYELSEQLERYRLEHPEAKELLVKQVKQKFGELRVYVQPADIAAVNDLIEAAAERSRQVCELTGQPGVLYENRGYYQTLNPVKARELFVEPG